jgi:hypothetical protein
MKTRKTFLFVTLSSLFLFSCKKNDTNALQDPLVGNWKFMSIAGTTQSTESYRLGTVNVREVTTLPYTSTAASGIYKITADQFNGEAIAYSIFGRAKFEIYENNILEDSLSIDFPYSLPASNSSSKYKKAGTDSLTFESGGIVSVSNGGTPQSTSGGGCKYKIEGNKLTLTVNGTQTTTEVQSGTTVTTVLKSNAVMVLQKQ